MKNVYRLTYNIDDYMKFALDDYELITLMGDDFNIHGFGEPMMDIWKTPNGLFNLSDTGSVKIPDISQWMEHVPVFNQMAYDIFYDLLKEDAEFLPVTIEGNNYYLVNLTTFIDNQIIDENNSEKRFVDGHEMGAKKLAFHHDQIPDELLLFKTHYDYGTTIFCGDRFKLLVEKHKLSGLLFSNELCPKHL